MKIVAIILGYLKWHYSKAFVSLTIVWRHFLEFIVDYFSIKLLFKNFFDPWKKMGDVYPKSFNLKIYFSVFMTNLIVRAIGMLLRTIFIILGLASLILLILLYPISIIVWLVLPFIIIGLFIFGITLIIN